MLVSIVVALTLWPFLDNPIVATLAHDFRPQLDFSTDISAPASALVIAATRTPVATLFPALVVPSATTTPTPLPNKYIGVPWRSQYDGTAYQNGNCGPASLAIAMSYYGEWWSTDGIRKSTNERSGVYAYDEGTDWPSLEYAAEKRSFKVVGLYDSGGAYRKWTIDDLVHEIEQHHPVLLLVRQRALPGHGGTNYYGEHYIVFLGLMADGRVVYHDPAFFDEIDGSYRIMSQETLLKAWGDTSVGLVDTAMSLVWEGQPRKWDDPAATRAKLISSRWRMAPLP